MTIYVLGAGPAAMAVVDGLVDAKSGDFVLLEQSAQLGGLAQTVYWENVGAHDLGPHKIFSLDNALVSRVERLLPESDWLTREKVSDIFINGHRLPYPPSPFSLSRVFGSFAFVRMVLGYGVANIKQLVIKKTPETFEEDLIRRVGKPLYEVLFQPIAKKLWGDPSELDVKLSLGRVQTPSLLEVIGRLLKIKSSSKFEALTFRYPKGGLGKIWSAIRRKSEKHGEFLLEHTITGLVARNNVLSEIHYDGKFGQGVIYLDNDDFVVSTLPLALTTKLLAGSLPDHLPRLADKVAKLNDLFLVFLHVDKDSLLEESWVFIPDPEIIFHRLSEQESFDPDMTPNGSIVCCEIMAGSFKSCFENSDEDLFNATIKGLHDMGYVDFKVLSKKVIRLPKSYPVFQVGFEKGLSELLNTIDRFENFRTIGRQGAFNYIGTLDAMDIGYGFAAWLSNEKKYSWQTERERTNHYPVLD
jgi:protoporphyrinogen oxidase